MGKWQFVPTYSDIQRSFTEKNLRNLIRQFLKEDHSKMYLLHRNKLKKRSSNICVTHFDHVTLYSSFQV